MKGLVGAVLSGNASSATSGSCSEHLVTGSPPYIAVLGLHRLCSHWHPLSIRTPEPHTAGGAPFSTTTAGQQSTQPNVRYRCRSNAVTITLFVAPQALLMQVPLIGPLVYVPMQYAAAWLLNMLLTDAPTRPPVAGAATYSQVIPGFLACAHCLGLGLY